MTDVRKVDAVSVNKPKATTTDPVEKEKAEKAKLNAEIQKTLITKADRKKAEEEAKQDFLKYGIVGSKDKVESEKQAEKMAKNYVKNKEREEDFYATKVYIDKEAYKAAEKERDTQRKALIEQYRQEGLSKKEAKQKAEAQLVENEYVGGKKTRKFIEQNKEMFYDEKGNFSSTKFKKAAFDFANLHTEEGEADNFYLSLKERREAAEKNNVKPNVIKNIAKKSNIGYEKDNTGLYRGLYVAGVTGAAAGLGAALGASGLLAGNVIATATSTATSTSNATANIYDKAGNIIESATATDTATSTDTATAKAKSGLATAADGAKAGSLLGLGIGLATMGFIKDKGNKEAKVYEPGKETVPPKPPVEPPVNPPVQPPVQPPVEPEPCPLTPDEEHEEICDYPVKKGEYWTGIVAAKYKREDGTGFTLDPKKRTKEENKEISDIVHYLKDKHGIKYSDKTQPDTIRLYSEINGKKYNIDCDADVKEKATDFSKSFKKYKGKAADGSARFFWVDCNGNRSKIYTSAEERDTAMAGAQQNQQPKKAA